MGDARLYKKYMGAKTGKGGFKFKGYFRNVINRTND